MISIVLYGRNDSYGYNLHKRAALSLNCMAEVLTDPADEIIFVDYNTPDDYPTFPEAIQDTLTERAQRMLRILRVRPSLHARFKAKSHLLALEPISRNIAVRRSSPANRWILSTNTDLIFVPRGSASLSDLARDLPTGLYHLPRFEIPESLWEGFDRLDAPGTIAAVRRWGEAAHLNEIVHMAPYIRFDGPGDFQLMERDEIFAIHGFHEEMLLGWHVDSNLAKRFFLRYGRTSDLVEHVFGYHCDHTRQVTPAHAHTRVSNDSQKFVDNVDASEIPGQAESWGCPTDKIEEIRLAHSASRLYARAIKKVIAEPMGQPSEAAYLTANYDRVDYDPPHVLPFLLDIFANAPRRMKIGWRGNRAQTLRLFAAAWKELGLAGSILLDAASTQYVAVEGLTGIEIKNRSEWLAEADAFICDFGLPEGTDANDWTAEGARSECLLAFLDVVRAEYTRARENQPPRRVVAVNAVHNRFEGPMRWHLSAAATPFSTRIRQGCVLPAQDEREDWFPRISAGIAGERVGATIVTRLGVDDWVFYGPYAYLTEGRYRISIGFGKVDQRPRVSWARPPLTVEVSIAEKVLAFQPVSWGAVASGSAALEFEINRSNRGELRYGGIEFRMRTRGTIQVAVQSVLCQWLGDITEEQPHSRQSDWLPILRTSKGAIHRDTSIRSRGLRREFIFYGPYWRLPTGRYRVTMRLRIRSLSKSALIYAARLLSGHSPGPTAPAFIFEIVDRELVVAHRVLALRDAVVGTTILDFDIAEEFAQDPLMRIECRLRGLTEMTAAVRSVVFERIGDAVGKSVPMAGRTDLLPLLWAGPGGERVGREIRARGGTTDWVFYGPSWYLPAGRYRIEVEFRSFALASGRPVQRDSDVGALPAFALEILDRGDMLAYAVLTAGEISAGRTELQFHMATGDRGTRIECRLRALLEAEFAIRSVILERIGDADAASAAEQPRFAWLPLLRTGDAGMRVGSEIRSRPGAEGLLFYGPYWYLRAGCYRIELGLNVTFPSRGERPGISNGIPAIAVEILDRNKTLAHRLLAATECDAGRAILDFEISQQLAMDTRMKVECRMLMVAGAQVIVHSLTLEYLDRRFLVAQPPHQGAAGRLANDVEARVGD